MFAGLLRFGGAIIIKAPTPDIPAEAATSFPAVPPHGSPQLDGLKVEPQFPSAWNEASIERLWRGSKYIVNVKRTGRKSVKMDGVELADGIIPIPVDKGVHKVDVEI